MVERNIAIEPSNKVAEEMAITKKEKGYSLAVIAANLADSDNAMKQQGEFEKILNEIQQENVDRVNEEVNVLPSEVGAVAHTEDHPVAIEECSARRAGRNRGRRLHE